MTRSRWLSARTLRWALLVAVLGAAAAFLVPRAGQALRNLHQLHGGDFAWLPVVLAAELASLLAFSLGTQVLISPGSRPRLRRVVRLDLVSVALSHAVPAGSAAGTALGYQLLEEEGVPAVESGFVKLCQAVLATVLLWVLLGVTLLLKIVLYGPSAANAGLAAVGGALTVLAGTFAWMLGYRANTLRAVTVRVLHPIPKVPAERIGDLLCDFSAHTRTLLSEPRRLAWAALWSLGNWVFDMLALWAALRAFGAPPNWLLVAVGFCIAQTAAMLPISPAGLGVVEGLLVPLLIGFGARTNVAVLGVLTWRLVNFWLPLPMGGAAYAGILVSRRNRRTRRQRREPTGVGDRPVTHFRPSHE